MSGVFPMQPISTAPKCEMRPQGEACKTSTRSLIRSGDPLSLVDPPIKVILPYLLAMDPGSATACRHTWRRIQHVLAGHLGDVRASCADQKRGGASGPVLKSGEGLSQFQDCLYFLGRWRSVSAQNLG